MTRAKPVGRRAGLAALALLLVACDGGGFDPQVWRAEKGNYEKENRRAGMLSGLLDGRLKPGMERKAVLDLLGPSDAASQEKEVYYLGRSAYGVDLETLEIVFDPGGRLVSARMTRS